MTRILSILLALFGLSGCAFGGMSSVPADISHPFVSQPESSQSAGDTSSEEDTMLKITVGEQEFPAAFEDNSSAREFQELLAQGPLTIQMEDYGGFEKVGTLGSTLTRNDQRITTQPGDVILYQGNQITIYYGTNTWSFTRLARITDLTGLTEALGDGTVQVIFSLA